MFLATKLAILAILVVIASKFSHSMPKHLPKTNQLLGGGDRHRGYPVKPPKTSRHSMQAALKLLLRLFQQHFLLNTGWFLSHWGTGGHHHNIHLKKEQRIRMKQLFHSLQQ